MDNILLSPSPDQPKAASNRILDDLVRGPGLESGASRSCPCASSSLGAASTSSRHRARTRESSFLTRFTRDVEDSDPLRVLYGAASAAQVCLRSIASIRRATTEVLEAGEATMADLRSTTRRSVSERRGSERRGVPYRSRTIVAHADEARAFERRTTLRRVKYRRSLLDRRAGAPPRLANRG